MSAAPLNASSPTVDHVADQQYVTFYTGEEVYAVPMTSVIEIIRLPATVRVPLTPGSLLGLANLRGNVLPVLCLRRVLGLEASEYSDASRVIVFDCGRPVGIVVDRVSRVLDIDASAIEDASRMSGTIASELLRGAAKSVGGHEVVQMLDLGAAIRREFVDALTQAVNETSLEARADAVESVGEQEEDAGVQLVSFVVCSQEYAFEIGEVEEIVRVPETISRVPGVPSHVLGLMNLRGRLLPLVSLRRLFHLADGQDEEDNRILVVSYGATGQRRSVGLVVDRIREVLRVAPDAREPVPELLRGSGDLGEITGICRLDGARRLVSVLSAAHLFNDPGIREALAADEHQREDAAMNPDLVSEGDLEAGEDETQMVVFSLAEQEFGLPIDSVREITVVPEAMTRVPKTPDFIDGLMNLRGSILPVIDMRTRFGLPRIDRHDRQRILVLDLNGIITGFTADAVLEVLRLSRSRIEQAPRITDAQARVFGQILNLRESGRMVQLLDAGQLLGQEEVQAIGGMA